ncbi:TauD/TfdA family dioxygenase [Vibrio aestuarianus]|uniref:TauD/TfdA family dioxygenase n=1 Tax=Vibrio aestuarianus TaxID=28171 RepID=A0A9X4ERG0_9VIBR|nr:TauD/TfdA family dioxygenase [Vibrio aestuarianus]MDE1240871.1 TauD/TfdA family dioxygenase [Vibrio aestuarianus]
MTPVCDELSTHLTTLNGEPMMLLTEGSMDAEWAAANREAIEQHLSQHGRLLLRGLTLKGSKSLGKFLTAVFGGELLEYKYRSTPRTRLRGNVYTSTEYHSDSTINLHNENSYANSWPLRIGFYCMNAAEVGGETPIADSRLIYRDMPAAIREEFEAKGLRYVRNYLDIDLKWSEVFQTNSKQDVDAFCQANQIEHQWLDGDGLRTSQNVAAVRRHPITGEKLWFNAAHMFHLRGLDEVVKQSMLASLAPDQLPRNVLFGDGSAIPDHYIDEILKVYQKHKFTFTWQEGDLMLLDNMLYAHAREPFRGHRKVMVGMGKEVRA